MGVSKNEYFEIKVCPNESFLIYFNLLIINNNLLACGFPNSDINLSNSHLVRADRLARPEPASEPDAAPGVRPCDWRGARLRLAHLCRREPNRAENAMPRPKISSILDQTEPKILCQDPQISSVLDQIEPKTLCQDTQISSVLDQIEPKTLCQDPQISSI